MARNKDFFRKPYMETPEDDYADMMRYLPDAAWPDYRSKPHSEMLKPYDDRIRGYNEMEHFEPSNFKIPEWPPSIDADPISGEPNPCEKWRRDPARFNLGFGSKQVWYEVPCGGSLSIDAAFQGGVPPYKSLGAAGVMGGSFRIDEDGGLHYDAPKECCADSWDNIMIGDACGNTANILIKTLAFDYLLSNYSTVIIGPDAPVNGDCYYLQTPIPGTIWTIDKGSIDSSGCVSGLGSECGAATITATFKCHYGVGYDSYDNVITATKKVRMPNGIWTIIYNSPSGCGGECGSSYTVITGDKKTEYWTGCNVAYSSTCDDTAGIIAAGGTLDFIRECPHGDCLPGQAYKRVIGTVYGWVCP